MCGPGVRVVLLFVPVMAVGSHWRVLALLQSSGLRQITCQQKEASFSLLPFQMKSVCLLHHQCSACSAESVPGPPLRRCAAQWELCVYLGPAWSGAISDEMETSAEGRLLHSWLVSVCDNCMWVMGEVGGENMNEWECAHVQWNWGG